MSITNGLKRQIKKNRKLHKEKPTFENDWIRREIKRITEWEQKIKGGHGVSKQSYP